MRDRAKSDPSLRLRAHVKLRELLGGLPVRRTVQGVNLWMPWAHRLPDYARLDPEYGQNLVGVAQGLVETSGPFVFVDVGANVGDSTLQVQRAAPGISVILVEADSYYLRYLRKNVPLSSSAIVEPVLLVPEEESTPGFALTRAGGTTRFAPADGGDRPTVLTVHELATRHQHMGRVGLVKTDTDGHDTQLVPAMARVWRKMRPVLFFEYDETLSAEAGDQRPSDVFVELASEGYTELAVWDNYGHPLFRLTTSEVFEALPAMRAAIAAGDYYYWDVAAVHAEHREGLQVVDSLIGDRSSG